MGNHEREMLSFTKLLKATMDDLQNYVKISSDYSSPSKSRRVLHAMMPGVAARVLLSTDPANLSALRILRRMLIDDLKKAADLHTHTYMEREAAKVGLVVNAA